MFGGRVGLRGGFGRRGLYVWMGAGVSGGLGGGRVEEGREGREKRGGEGGGNGLGVKDYATYIW